MSQTVNFPLFADGVNLNQQELIACQSLANAIPQRHSKVKAQLAGHRGSNIKGRGMEFAEVRQYQNGDDVRTIDWRVTARTGKTHTKLFVEERERPVILLVDLSYSLYFGSQLLLQAVQACHLAATLGWHAIKHGDRLGGLIATESEHLELKPRNRKQGILQLISGLERIHEHQLKHFDRQQTEPEHLFKAYQRLQRLAKPGSLIYIISDGQDFTPQCQQPLTELKRHCDIRSFVITDPLRQGTLALPKQFQLPIIDGKQKRTLNRGGYQTWLEIQLKTQNDYIAMLNKLNIHTSLIDAGQNLAQQLEVLR